MIYPLYHWLTGTHMDENGLPAWVDALGGLLDLLLVTALVWVIVL